MLEKLNLIYNLVVGRDTKSSKKSFYHYTGSGSHLWTNQRARYIIYPVFNTAFHTVSLNILITKCRPYSLDRQAAKCVKKQTKPNQNTNQTKRNTMVRARRAENNGIRPYG